MNRTAVYIVLAAIAVIPIQGCAPKRTPYAALYASLQEKPAAADRSVLSGRRIVIDPGHGGFFDGAVGVDSLRECDVNLGVALYLWGLLEEAGADVRLTRTTDRDFLPEGSTELSDDLRTRMELANAAEPEVFVSIHHNSHTSADRYKNKVEVYYRSDDTGASLELARDIHLHLARNLGIDDTEIKPGNYFVLRNSRANASVLGEASYISHPVVEKRLQISNKQRLEAEAYFLGLLHFFSRGVPIIRRLEPAADTLSEPAVISFAVDQTAQVPIDPASAKITVGKKSYAPAPSTDTAEIRFAMDPNTPNGSYTVQASIRSVRGATAKSKSYTILLARPAAFILPLPAARHSETAVSLGCKVLDALGNPVADGTSVTARSVIGGGNFTGTTSGGEFQFAVAIPPDSDRFVVETAGKRDTIRFEIEELPAPYSLVVVDAKTGAPVPFPLATRIGAPEQAQGESTYRGDGGGRLFPADPFPGERLIVSADGYIPALFEKDGEKRHDVVLLHPLFEGTVRGKRIALDPAGGGTDPGGEGADRLRGASINLAVATLLADALTKAGARVTVTRGGEETLSPEERVDLVNRYRSDAAVGIHHGSTPAGNGSCSILHYPGSRKGAEMAAALAFNLGTLPPCGELRVVESAGLFLQQTNCPACEVHFGSVADEAHERIFTNPRFAYLETERILAALISYFGNGECPCMNRMIRVEENGRTVTGATVCIDQVLTNVTDEEGAAPFCCISPGRHLISIEVPGGSRQYRFQDFQSGDPPVLILEVLP